MTALLCPTSDGDKCPNVSDIAMQQAQALDGAALKEPSDAAYIRMRDAFIRWNVFGCFNAAAEYAEARTAWELALMEQGGRAE